MNSIPSSLEQMQNPAASLESETVNLSCPVCNKELRIFRKHFGIEGSCVHCDTPVKAVEDQTGNIVVENLSVVPSFAASPPPFQSKPEENKPEEKPDKPSVIPPKFEQKETQAIPPAFPEEEATFSSKPKRKGGIQSIPYTQESKKLEDRLTKSTEENPALPFESDSQDTTLLFAGEPSPPPMESDISGGARTPWDEDPSTEPEETGLAEALFSGKPGGSSEGSNLQATADSPPKTGTSQIGHPLQQANMKKLKSSDSKKAFSSLVKWTRNIAVIAILAALGYLGLFMVPQEKLESARIQIKEWLKPGAVLLDDLPFKIPGLSDNESGHGKPVVVKRKETPVASSAPVEPRTSEPVPEEAPQ